jgi:hypothetical protein
MADQKIAYEKRAEQYEEQAKRVTDPWVKEKYLALAKRCRDMQKCNAQALPPATGRESTRMCGKLTR